MAPDLDSISPAHAMEGYLKKPKKWSKRYFVLREGSPPCLEYYDSHRRKGKPSRVIELKDVWNIDKKVSGKQKHVIGIYTEKEYFCMAADSDSNQINWVNAIRQAVLANRGNPAISPVMYKHIWHGNVDTKDLADCDPLKKQNLQGPHRCCLTEKTMVFIPVDSSGACKIEAQNHLEITIASIRSCGHQENVFFMEPGRSSGIGIGQLRIELDDSAVADNMHMTILKIWNPTTPTDDSRNRSYSSGSGSYSSARQGIQRSRQYYCPPPKQVGLGKSPMNTAPTPHPSSYPTKFMIPDDSRQRASSEGQAALKLKQKLMKRYNSHRDSRIDSVSPHSKSRLDSLRAKEYIDGLPPPHCRTTSLPGSILLSNGDGQSSADEYVDTTFRVPPPPDTDPATITLPMCRGGRVTHCHSRNRSLDDNTSTATSSLSSSPYSGFDMPASTNVSQEGSFCADANYTLMSYGHGKPVDAEEYIQMGSANPALGSVNGITAYTAPCTEDPCGYVPMRPLNHSDGHPRSQPKDIQGRTPFFDHRYMNGSNSPTGLSPSKSPDKQSLIHKMYPHNIPNHCSSSYLSTVPRPRPSQLNTRQHGVVNGSGSSDSIVFSNDYASMGDYGRNDDYLHMSPMIADGSKNVVVKNIISVSTSETKKAAHSHSQQYPHEMLAGNAARRNSFERSIKTRNRRNTVSSGISMHWVRSTRPKQGRRCASRTETRSLSDSSHGGEYVSIDFDKAKKQVGPGYITLTVSEGDISKVTHDSNGNILPNVESTTKDENQHPK